MGMPTSLATTHEWVEREGVMVVVRRDWRDALPVDAMLSGLPLEQWGRPVHHRLAGRGPVHVMDTANGEIVAKQLSRGGLAGGLARHTYFDRWRPVREAAVAEALRVGGCRTPPVVAVRCTRAGPGGWRLELATARVPGGRDLLEVATEARAAGSGLDRLARAAGLTVRRLHDAGLRHRDLQLKNLLVAPGGPADGKDLVVLDLDRCTLAGPLAQAERVASLARLGRSALKHGLGPAGTADDSSGVWWTRHFFTAYGTSGGRSAAAWLRVVRRRLRQRVAAHRLFWPSEADGRVGETPHHP